MNLLEVAPDTKQGFKKMNTGRILRKTMYGLFLTVILGCSAAQAFAESTVWIFMRGVGGTETNVSINGKKAFDMIGPVRKTFDDVDSYKIPYTFYHPVKRKCVLKSEGKVLFSVDLKHTNPMNLKVSHMAAEIQLNLEDGSEHYIEIGTKGLNDCQFKEIPEKKVKKYMENKKYKELPDFIEQ